LPPILYTIAYMKKILATVVLAYFRSFAQIRIRRFHPLIIGITGSAGKTSTRDAVAAVFPDSVRLKISEKANSESGIPLNILELSPHDYSLLDWLRLLLLAPIRAFSSKNPFDVYVVEMGIDSPFPPKNMEYLLSIIQPQIGIFLNAFPTHAAAFDSLVPSKALDRTQKIIEVVATEKAKLICQLPETGLAIVNADSQVVMDSIDGLLAPRLTFGKTATADLIISSVSRAYEATSIRYSYHGEQVTLRLPYALPDHFAYSFAAAILVGISRHLSLLDSCKSIEKQFTLPPGRASLLAGIHDSRLIDSSYNASAQPTIDMISLLGSLPARRHLALLGDMRELGEETKPEHERVIDAALQTCDVIYLVGPLMKKYALPQAIHAEKDVRWFASSREAGAFLKQELSKGDVLLIKGSQNTLYMEIAVEMLLGNAVDSHQLCHRGTYWDNVRKKIS